MDTGLWKINRIVNYAHAAVINYIGFSVKFDYKEALLSRLKRLRSVF